MMKLKVLCVTVLEEARRASNSPTEEMREVTQTTKSVGDPQSKISRSREEIREENNGDIKI